MAQAPVQFGFDAKSVNRARSLGMPVTYGSTWAGAWNQKWGWNGIEQDLLEAKAAGAVPVVQWWYWGDDISPSCVENGCTDRYQGVQKDKATWTRLSNELADLIVSVGGADSQALVVIETEFNKNGIENYEPFDGYLAEQAAIFHQRGLKVIVSFGSWGQPYWTNFDRAVASADLLGTMALQSSIRDASTYLSGADQLITAAQYFQTTFAKPTFVTDFAFSSYPEPSYEVYQDTVVRDIFGRMGEFSAAGVQGMVWRMLSDDPAFDTNNYHGVAERHWGLLHADGFPKLAFAPFRDGMIEAAAAAPPPVALPAAPTSLSAVAGNAQVSLTWAVADGASGYSVKYATASGGPYQPLASGLTTRSFTQTGLTNGVTYYYVVTATNTGGESANSSQVSAVPVAPIVVTNLSTWWPTDGATLSGTQPFKARVENMVLTDYRMYWQVDGGKLNGMFDSQIGGAHKEASVKVDRWTWRGAGPYVITFVAKDLTGKTLAQKSVSVYVAK
ncbi:MAG: fibronectin type III domain-containing protein [Acidobacteriota bacterium]|nr:fibronectin type III domain-containing protein [Acidobacteriota bacterium]